MSNRFERTSDKKQVEKHQSILKQLLNENKFCADCKKRDPRWASVNLGIFICLRCSGIHRSLGVHISKVRSVDLDTWTPEHIENMTTWGNKRANFYWEFGCTPKPFEPEESKIESFIRAKYERKAYVRPGAVPSASEIDNLMSGTGTTSHGAPQQQLQQPPQQQQFHSNQQQIFSLQSPPKQETSAPLPSIEKPPVPLQTTSNAKSNIMSLYSQAPAIPQNPAGVFAQNSSNMYYPGNNPAMPSNGMHNIGGNFSQQQQQQHPTVRNQNSDDFGNFQGFNGNNQSSFGNFQSFNNQQSFKPQNSNNNMFAQPMMNPLGNFSNPQPQQQNHQPFGNFGNFQSMGNNGYGQQSQQNRSPPQFNQNNYVPGYSQGPSNFGNQQPSNNGFGDFHQNQPPFQMGSSQNNSMTNPNDQNFGYSGQNFGQIPLWSNPKNGRP